MTVKQISEIIDEAKGLKDFTAVLTEVSSIRLRRIRKQVQNTRIFFNGLASLYSLVKAMNPHLNFKKQGTVSILLTSNLRFNGYLNESMMRFFISQTAKFKTDRIIVGSMINKILTATKYPYPFTSFVFQKDLPSSAELNGLVRQLTDYEQILVFYSEFKTVLKQVPTIKDITQTEKAAVEQATIKKKAFILEPELPKILQFFDTRIKVALLHQAFLEAELSRIATRLVTMDEAQRNAQAFLNQQQTLLSLAKRSLENKRILEAQAYFFLNKL